MKTLVSFFALIAVGALCLSAQQVAQPQQHTHLKVGDVAPDFALGGTKNFNFKLSDFKGKKNVVIAFFPAAFTQGCTTEMTAYTKENSKFTDANTQVVGVSTDFIATLNHWATELDATFPLLSDHARTVTKQYGILSEGPGPLNGTAVRTTFVVDADGKIASITENRDAVDISGALAACSRLAKH